MADRKCLRCSWLRVGAVRTVVVVAGTLGTAAGASAAAAAAVGAATTAAPDRARFPLGQGLGEACTELRVVGTTNDEGRSEAPLSRSSRTI